MNEKHTIKLIDQINEPESLKNFSRKELEQLASEIRESIIETVSKNGGHLASNLGMVELTIALLMVFEFPRDKIVFDVGHQTYAWKLLTGRKDRFCSLRRYGGISGFPKTDESCFDCFNTGHSSTSISAAIGLSRAMARSNRAGHVIAVIGDGALTGGMAFEALNDAGHSRENLIVILNDNQMSIGRNVGGLSRHLENLRLSKSYLHLRTRFENLLSHIPLIGRPILRLIERVKQMTKMAVKHQGIFFEELGFQYYGPVDGHDLSSLTHHLKAIGQLKGPVLLHVVTQKGKGYTYAEYSPDLYHGVAPFIIENGLSNGQQSQESGIINSFSDAFGRHLVEKAKDNTKICAISAAMTNGTGLTAFQQSYPGRFFDVGIAEQHAMTFAAGLAAGGMKPVIALYSTFLQRAFDQLLHDVCLQNLPVVLAVDRAGIVGEDGETHQGLFDLSLLLPLPNIEVFCPSDYHSLRAAVDYALLAEHPVAIRYPRGKEPQHSHSDSAGTRADTQCQSITQTTVVRQGDSVTIAALGSLLGIACEAADQLAEQGIAAEVVSIVRVKPFDHTGLAVSVEKTRRLITLEESVITGGFGQMAIAELMSRIPDLSYKILGIGSGMLCQGKRDELLHLVGLDVEAVCLAAGELCRVVTK